MYTERTPFYLISVIFLLTTIILSFVTTFNMKKNISQYLEVYCLFCKIINLKLDENGLRTLAYLEKLTELQKLSA